MKNQELAFRKSEGNKWYLRNLKKLEENSIEISLLCNRLMPFQNDINNILELSKIFKEHNKEKDKKIPILKGRTIINLFFEPSTRTLISFEIAAKRLGADVINMNIEGSSLRKGESLFDTAQTLGAMNPDLVIIRHGENDASKEIAKILECPVINAGEGVNEHPTQALLDAYTIMNHNRKLNDITVSICGDLEHSRVARSNYYLLNKMKSKVRFVFPDYFKPKDLDKYDVETFTNLEEGIKDADIVMMLRIQNERIKDLNLPSADDYLFNDSFLVCNLGDPAVNLF